MLTMLLDRWWYGEGVEEEIDTQVSKPVGIKTVKHTQLMSITKLYISKDLPSIRDVTRIVVMMHTFGLQETKVLKILVKCFGYGIMFSKPLVEVQN